MEKKSAWGSQDFVVIAAYRYWCGRMSYITTVAVSWLITHWKNFEEETRQLIIKETEEAIAKGRAGMQCDVDLWKKLLEYAHKSKS